jgi:hypothetical protein
MRPKKIGLRFLSSCRPPEASWIIFIHQSYRCPVPIICPIVAIGRPKVIVSPAPANRTSSPNREIRKVRRKWADFTVRSEWVRQLPLPAASQVDCFRFMQNHRDGISQKKRRPPSKKGVPALRSWDQNMNELVNCHSWTGAIRAAAHVWPSGSTEIGIRPSFFPTL